MGVGQAACDRSTNAGNRGMRALMAANNLFTMQPKL
jgi:hypothetical protein